MARISFPGTKRVSVVPRALRKIIDVRGNFTLRSVRRGRASSVSIKILNFVTWNPSRRTVHVDLPGPVDPRFDYGDSNRKARAAGRRHEWARVTLGVVLTLLLAGGVALWSWVAEVMAR